MAATASRSSRRPLKAVEHTAHPRPHPGLAARLRHAAASPQARAFYIAAGAAGLAALAVAMLGPRRLERRLVRPLVVAAAPQAERLWAETRALRAQIAGLFETAGPGRDRLAQRLQSWIGHFRAS